MGDRSSCSPIFLRSAFALSALILCSLGTMQAARADNPLGLYIGAGYGQAHIRVHPGEVIPGSSGPLSDLDETHTAFKGMIGVRPLSFIGAEVSYMDFGTVTTMNGQLVPLGAGNSPASAFSEQASQKGEAAFAMLYLPVPVIDVYVKAGVSRITTDYSVAYSTISLVTCPTGESRCGTAVASRDSTDTGFAYGAGVQWKLGNWAVRGEYERFDAAGTNPSMLSIGMTYWP
jgi:opacity protein-like surface antigen